MLSRVLAVTACALLIPAVQASAQIYAWRDANGTLVLSDKTKDLFLESIPGESRAERIAASF